MNGGPDTTDTGFDVADDDPEVRRRYRAMIDLVDGGLYQLDPDGRFVAVDDAFADATGYPREALLGDHLRTVMADDADRVERDLHNRQATPATDVETFEAALETADGDRQPVELRHRGLLADGQLHGVLGVARERPRDARQPSFENPLPADETTTSVLEEADVGVFILDEAFDVAWVDSTAAEYFGLDTEAAIGRDKRELIAETIQHRVADAEAFAERVLATYDDNTYVERFECRVETPDGEERWLEHRSRPIESGRYTGGRIELYYDISDQRRRADQLRRLNEAVREWLERDTKAAVAERASDDLLEILDMEVNGVFLYDEEARALQPVAWSQPAETLFGAIPTFGEGEGVAWRVFESGQPEVYDDVRDAPDVYDPATPIRSEIVLPVGDHGIVEIGSMDREAFDEGDVTLAKIVASTLEVTFDRLENQRRLEARKAELETELGAILERVTDAFYAVDEEFRFTHVNERTEELLRHDEAELLGERLWDVFPAAADDETVRTAFETALAEQELQSYVRYDEHLDAWIEANLYPSESGISVYFRDVTDRKERERALEASNERLEQFAYAASHDLQEPLRMVTSYLQLLERRYGDELDEEALEFLAFAVDGADRMREMIQGLLAYSRVESRGDEFQRVDLGELVDDVLADLQLTLVESGADLEVESLPVVEGDASQLRQVFQNLLENAVEYSGDAPPRIRVSADRHGDQWLLSIADEGIGIDPGDADRIFEIFQRLHSRENHPGTGIGLALCERIVERHGGDIWVDSEPGEGSTFYFTLPAVETRED